MSGTSQLAPTACKPMGRQKKTRGQKGQRCTMWGGKKIPKRPRGGYWCVREVGEKKQMTLGPCLVAKNFAK